MPSSKTWPQDARPDYIVRQAKRLALLETHAQGDSPFAVTALQVLADHYAALAAMQELKTVLDNYVDGVKP